MRFIEFLTEAPFAKKTYRTRGRKLKSKPGSVAPAKRTKKDKRWVKDMFHISIWVTKTGPSVDAHRDEYVQHIEATRDLPYQSQVQVAVPVNKWREILRTRAIQKLPIKKKLTAKEYDELTSGIDNTYSVDSKLPDRMFREKYGYDPLFTRTKGGALRVTVDYRDYPTNLMRVFFADDIGKQVDRAMVKEYGDAAKGIYSADEFSGSHGWIAIWKKIATKTFINSLRVKWKEVNADVYADLDEIQKKLNTNLDANSAHRKQIHQYKSQIKTKLTQMVDALSAGTRYPVSVTGFTFSTTSAGITSQNSKIADKVAQAGRTKVQKGYGNGGGWYDIISVRMKLDHMERFSPMRRKFIEELKTEFANEPYALDFHGVGHKGVRLIMHGIDIPKAVRRKAI